MPTKVSDKAILNAIARAEKNVKVGISVRALAQRLGVTHPTLVTRLHKMVELGMIVSLGPRAGYAVAHRKQSNGKSRAEV